MDQAGADALQWLWTMGAKTSDDVLLKPPLALPTRRLRNRRFPQRLSLRAKRSNLRATMPPWSRLLRRPRLLAMTALWGQFLSRPFVRGGVGRVPPQGRYARGGALAA